MGRWAPVTLPAGAYLVADTTAKEQRSGWWKGRASNPHRITYEVMALPIELPFPASRPLALRRGEIIGQRVGGEPLPPRPAFKQLWCAPSRGDRQTGGMYQLGAL